MKDKKKKKNHTHRKPSSGGTSALVSPSAGCVEHAAFCTTLSKAQMEELKGWPLRVTSKFPSFNKNALSPFYKQGIVL